MEHLTLFFRQGSSDKTYQASIVPKDGGFVVQFQYGRRGSALQSGQKNPEPVPYDEAKRIYDKLICEKLAKGYSPGESGVPYQQTDHEARATGILPMLLNPIDAEAAARLVTDPAWAIQEKFDGRRQMIEKQGDTMIGINRRGLVVALPEPVVNAAREIPGSFLLDGEALGDTLVIFDLLALHGTDHRSAPYRDRLFALMQFVPGHGPHLRTAETAFDTAHKAELLQRLHTDNKEGAVFKKLAGTYTPGRPASGGDALKLKFHETASFIVGKVNAKRSVSLLLFEGDKIKPAGNVTIPPSHNVPAAGQIVECRFLYAFRESGAIYQPLFIGRREDILAEECTTAQLKYRPEPTEVAA